VIIDTLDVINTMNHFPTEEKYRCFLLSRNNVVLAVGNPVQDPAVWELYQKIILEGSD